MLHVSPRCYLRRGFMPFQLCLCTNTKCRNWHGSKKKGRTFSSVLRVPWTFMVTLCDQRIARLQPMSISPLMSLSLLGISCLMVGALPQLHKRITNNYTRMECYVWSLVCFISERGNRQTIWCLFNLNSMEHALSWSNSVAYMSVASSSHRWLIST